MDTGQVIREKKIHVSYFPFLQFFFILTQIII